MNRPTYGIDGTFIATRILRKLGRKDHPDRILMHPDVVAEILAADMDVRLDMTSSYSPEREHDFKLFSIRVRVRPEYPSAGFAFEQQCQECSPINRLPGSPIKDIKLVQIGNVYACAACRGEGFVISYQSDDWTAASQ